MPDFTAELNWIDSQRDHWRDLLIQWSLINTGSHNLPGLARQLEQLESAFAPLAGQMQRRTLPPQQLIDRRGQIVAHPLGEALAITKRPEADRRVFLGIHMDTVYGPDHPFQSVHKLDDNRLRGPGVADAKGGLVVMLAAISALERSAFAQRLGWQVFINPDEELGSPGSDALLREYATQSDLGFVFEPALPDGKLISARKGSGNFTVVVRGRSAHAGRDFDHGRNAVTALAHIVTAMEELSGSRPGLTVNIANVRGGGPSNIVPELAIARLNARLWLPEDQHTVMQSLQNIVHEINNCEGFSAELHGNFTAPPKPLNDATAHLLQVIADCGRELDTPIAWRESGGVCDGNRLADAGLPNVDTLGVIGGAIHSEDEYVLLDSITQRAKLTALLLLKLAAREIDLP